MVIIITIIVTTRRWHVTISYANRMDARHSQFDLGRVDAYI